MADTNRSIGELLADALEEVAERKSDAERLEKLAKRVFSELVIRGDAGSVAAREHSARCHAKFTAVEDEWITAQSAYNAARARADGLQVRFEEWRTRSATNRAEMQLR